MVLPFEARKVVGLNEYLHIRLTFTSHQGNEWGLNLQTVRNDTLSCSTRATPSVIGINTMSYIKMGEIIFHFSILGSHKLVTPNKVTKVGTVIFLACPPKTPCKGNLLSLR